MRRVRDHWRPPVPDLDMTNPISGSFRFDTVHDREVGGTPVLDEATFGALQELAGEDDPDLMLDLVALFLDDSSSRMAEMEKAITGGDFATIGRVAHTLMSSSANIGALAFSGVCAKLEATSRVSECKGEDVEELVDRAIRMYRDVCAALGGDAQGA